MCDVYRPLCLVKSGCSDLGLTALTHLWMTFLDVLKNGGSEMSDLRAFLRIGIRVILARKDFGGGSEMSDPREFLADRNSQNSDPQGL